MDVRQNQKLSHKKKKNSDFNKKSISPVVAIALLLVVSVVAVVGFQTWFQSYESNIFSNTEQQSQFGNLQIQTIVGGNLYLKGKAEIQSVKVNGNDCFVSGVTSENLNIIPINDCAEKGENDIVVVTNQGVFEKRILLNNYQYKNPCPEGYIIVPGNIDLGTKNFCVMKYEAKNVGGKPTSQADLTPWVSLTWQQAKSNCENLGKDYHLITDDEWLTIAHNVEFVSKNWNSSIVGNGFLYSGHNDGNPDEALNASNNDYEGYYGTGNSNNSNQRRTLFLSNNEVIWDLAGNVWEWTNYWIYSNLSYGSPYRYHGGDQQWMSYNSDDGTGKIASLVPKLKLPSNNWNANQGMGRYYDGGNISGGYNNINESPDYCIGHCSSKVVFFRSGYWGYGKSTGIFTLYLDLSFSSAYASPGFRCSYTP